MLSLASNTAIEFTETGTSPAGLVSGEEFSQLSWVLHSHGSDTTVTSREHEPGHPQLGDERHSLESSGEGVAWWESRSVC